MTFLDSCICVFVRIRIIEKINHKYHGGIKKGILMFCLIKRAFWLFFFCEKQVAPLAFVAVGQQHQFYN